MRIATPPDVLEYRRRLAVQRLFEGYSIPEVADFLGVDPRSVRRWLAAYRRHGDDGLRAQPTPGRPHKLTSTQKKIVLRWLSDLPSEYGFPTDLWSALRLANLIEQEFGVSFNPDYLTTWLRQQSYTPQKPRRAPRERNDEAIARWLGQDWPRIKRKARRRDASLFLRAAPGSLRAAPGSDADPRSFTNNCGSPEFPSAKKSPIFYPLPAKMIQATVRSLLFSPPTRRFCLISFVESPNGLH